jgi:drug/metabolite transporter (DMT)-like permease
VASSRAEPPRLRGVLAILALATIAGSSAVAIRVGGRELAPFFGAGVRFGAAAVILWVIVGWRQLGLPRGRALAGAVLIGFLIFGIGNGLFYFGLVEAPAGLGQLVVSAAPLLTVAFAWFHRVEPFHVRSLVGAALGIAGVALIIGFPGGKVSALSLIALLGTAACSAEAFVLAKKFPDVHPITTNAIGMAGGTLVLLTASLLLHEPHAFPKLAATWYTLGFNVVVASVVFFALYIWLVQAWTPTSASYFILLAPAVALGLGAWLDREPITVALLGGGVLVIAGVYLGAIRGLTSSPSRGR